ncbi:MAG TPA: TIGR03960 family B12-binding radical SAM protein [Armatimonadetes bacterium]|nr:TIGR03960 family B12-binding radical SAM protein [Armatimonadota bacterium]
MRGESGLGQWLHDFALPRVRKPGRYTGGEWNQIVKSPPPKGAVHVLLIYPDIYEVGMSNLGLQILYGLLNERPEVVCERAFSPWPDMEGLMRSHGIELFSLETKRPAREFDIIGFSLQTELNFTNVLNLLDLARLPLRSEERTVEHPLVIAGGPCTSNPEPMADFIDAFIIGDGEEAILEVVEVYKDWRRRLRRRRVSGEADKRGWRRGLLLELSQIEGVYVPSLYKPEYDSKGRFVGLWPVEEGVPPTVRKRVVRDLDAVYFPERQIVPFIDIVHNRITIEIARGCRYACKFCQATCYYRGWRVRSAERILELADKLVRSTGFEEIGLTSLISTDHPEIEGIVEELLDRYRDYGLSVSLPSMRMDTFSVTLAGRLQGARRTGLTFAPEAAHEALRFKVGKRIKDDEVWEALEAALCSGWNSIKLYFMVGLPGEGEEDVLAIAELAEEVVRRAQRWMGRRFGRLRLHLSVAPFVPKAQTPFQREGQMKREELQRRKGLLKGAIRSRRHIFLDFHDIGMSFVEAALSRADRRVAKAVELAWRGGCKFDAWGDKFSLKGWLSAFEGAGLKAERYANESLPPEAPLPWGHIRLG